MCAAPTEHVHVQLIRLGEEEVWFVAHEGEALEEADADAAVCDDLGQRERRGFDIESTLDDLEVRCYCSEVVVCALVCEVA